MFCHGRRWDGWGSWAEDEVREAEPVAVARDPDVRVSQAERDEVAAVLGRHYADGRLAVDEYEERVGAAFEARTGRDLDGVLSDLPALAERPATAAPRPGAAVRWRELAPYLPRVLAVTAVVLLAAGSGLWLLWLLWPALALTSPHRHRRHHPRYTHHHRSGPSRPRYGGHGGHGERAATRWL